MALKKIKVVDPFLVNEIVDKDNFHAHLNGEMDVTDPADFPGVKRTLVPVDLGRLRELRFTEVDPGISVPAHSHRSPIFRLITSGEAVVNGKKYEKGDWMVIPAGTAYSIHTDTGYLADWKCVVCW